MAWSDLIPFIRYEDAPAAIDFLERAFGFERHSVHEGADGRIEHAELTHGTGMLMLGSTRDDDSSARTPRQLDGATTGGIYVVVDDVDAHCERARQAGAEIVQELADQDYGSRDYAARDPEGFVWNFGTYRPE